MVATPVSWHDCGSSNHAWACIFESRSLHHTTALLSHCLHADVWPPTTAAGASLTYYGLVSLQMLYAYQTGACWALPKLDWFTFKATWLSLSAFSTSSATSPPSIQHRHRVSPSIASVIDTGRCALSKSSTAGMLHPHKVAHHTFEQTACHANTALWPAMTYNKLGNDVHRASLGRAGAYTYKAHAHTHTCIHIQSIPTCSATTSVSSGPGKWFRTA